MSTCLAITLLSEGEPSYLASGLEQNHNIALPSFGAFLMPILHLTV